MDSNQESADSVHIGEKIVAWFREFGRHLPFREDRNPYKIWIAEIIFQQTRISQGLEYYRQFLQRFPDVLSLAKATLDEVLLMWKGLGYYSRALNLHTAAQQVVNDFQGEFPRHYSDILSLKGVGKYTAAAIASLAYGQPYPAVDGNLYRVLSRVFADDFDIAGSGAFSHFEKLAYRMMPTRFPAEFNEGMMDLGSEICTPREPLCIICPLQQDCLAFATGTVEKFPFKSKKTAKAEEEMKYFALTAENFILVHQRNQAGIWKSLWEFSENVPTQNFQVFSEKKVVHLLTHKRLTLHLAHIGVASAKILKEIAQAQGGLVIPVEDLKNYAFPKPLQDFLPEILGHLERNAAGNPT